MEKTTFLDEIESIDEAVIKLDKSLEAGSGNYNITPETEFWAHCSNLQIWYEYEYDTRLIHSNLAFPLLKKLTEAGDSIAKRVFKNEIASRFSSGIQSVQEFLIETQYFDYLSEEEQRTLFENSPMEEYIRNKYVKFNKEIHSLLYYIPKLGGAILAVSYLAFTKGSVKNFIAYFKAYPIKKSSNTDVYELVEYYKFVEDGNGNFRNCMFEDDGWYNIVRNDGYDDDDEYELDEYDYDEIVNLEDQLYIKKTSEFLENYFIRYLSREIKESCLTKFIRLNNSEEEEYYYCSDNFNMNVIEFLVKEISFRFDNLRFLQDLIKKIKK